MKKREVTHGFAERVKSWSLLPLRLKAGLGGGEFNLTVFFSRHSLSGHFFPSNVW
jgi:hypothetical protein